MGGAGSWAGGGVGGAGGGAGGLEGGRGGELVSKVLCERFSVKVACESFE